MAAFFSGQRTIPEGSFTQTIYGLIKDNRHVDAIEHLVIELQVRASFKLFAKRSVLSSSLTLQLTPCAANTRTCAQNSPENHAALSLLGYCYYYSGQFDQAIDM